MITNQDIKVEGNDFHIRNTFDIGTAKSLVAEQNKDGGEKGKTIRCLGHIPPEMFAYDPWLIAATKARNCGDMGEYKKHILKFFDLHPYLKTTFSPNVYNLGGAY